MQQDAVAQRLLASWTAGAPGSLPLRGAPSSTHLGPRQIPHPVLFSTGSLLDVVLDALDEPLSNPSDIQDWTWRHDLATYLSADHAV